MKVSLKFLGRGLSFALLFALCAAGALAAPQQPSTGILRGQVTDEFGGVIVGATVTVVDAEGKEKSTVSNNDGNYALAGLAPGTYIVRAISPGFALYENAEVLVNPGRTEPLNITLGVSLEKEEVTVASEGPLSVEGSSAGAIVLKGKDLEALPDDPDELAAALSALAGPAAGPNGGQITIDGFEGGRIPPRDSIREIRVNDNPLAAERDQPGFGGIQILTRPGSDRLRGSLYSTFMDESFNSRNPILQSDKRPPFQLRQYGGNLSGTLIPKKASFFFDFERSETDDNDIINARLLDPLTGDVVGFNQAVLTPSRRMNTGPRFDYAFNQNHTLVARYNYFQLKQENLGVSTFSLPERAFDSQIRSHTLQLTETAILNKQTVNETRFQFIRNRREQESLTDGVAINVSDAFTSGGATVGNSFAEDTRWEVSNNTTIAKGLHAIKFGARVRGIRVSDFSEGNFNGTFTFSSLDQFADTLAGEDIPTQFSIAGGEPLTEVSQVDFGGFLQDDWKIRPNLTLGAGLRYEAQTNIGSKFNFAPRVFVAWSPDGGGQAPPKTVIRLGFGIFYDRIAESLTLQQRRFNGVNQRQFVVRDNAEGAEDILSLFPNIPTFEQLDAFGLPQVTRQLADDITAPYSYTVGLIAERQLPAKFTLSIFAITYNTRHALRSRNINAPLPDSFTEETPFGVRPRPALGDIYQFESSGTQNMKQFNIGLRNQINRVFSVFGNYNLGKAESDTDGPFSFPANQYDVSGEYGRTFWDARHRFTFGGSFAVPYLKLMLNPIVIARTGQPFNITTGFDDNRDGIINDRPAFADAQTTAEDLVRTQWGDFDRRPKAGQTIIPRNYGEGPGFVSVNLRISRQISFGDMPGATKAAAPAGGGQGGGNRGGQQRGGAAPAGGAQRATIGQGPPGGGMMMGGGGGGEQKRYNLTFSLFITNLLNRTNLASPIGNLGSDRFGESVAIVGGFGGGGNAAAGNRRVQASVRFSF